MHQKTADPVVNVASLDYRAGYVQALSDLSDRLQTEMVRVNLKQAVGLRFACSFAKDLRNAMIHRIRTGR